MKQNNYASNYEELEDVVVSSTFTPVYDWLRLPVQLPKTNLKLSLTDRIILSVIIRQCRIKHTTQVQITTSMLLSSVPGICEKTIRSGLQFLKRAGFIDWPSQSPDKPREITLNTRYLSMMKEKWEDMNRKGDIPNVEAEIKTSEEEQVQPQPQTDFSNVMKSSVEVQRMVSELAERIIAAGSVNRGGDYLGWLDEIGISKITNGQIQKYIQRTATNKAIETLKNGREN